MTVAVPSVLALKQHFAVRSHVAETTVSINKCCLTYIVGCCWINLFFTPFSFSFLTRLLNTIMFPAGVVPKSMGPPPRDPLPTWATPASRRTAEEVSFHYRGFTGEFEFRVPRGEASMMAQRVIQNRSSYTDEHLTDPGTSVPIGNVPSSKSISSDWRHVPIC